MLKPLREPGLEIDRSSGVFSSKAMQWNDAFVSLQFSFSGLGDKICHIVDRRPSGMLSGVLSRPVFNLSSSTKL